MAPTSKMYSLAGKRVWVAGHGGMVGSALVRRLRGIDCHVVTVDRADLDLRRQAEVEQWMAETKPQAVFLAAATVGGIQANASRPAEFIVDNLAITANVLGAAAQVGVEKLLFPGSSCVYPRLCAQPMVETDLMTGPFEPTNEPYAVAKMAGISLCRSYRRQYGCDFISVIPTNLFGPGDNLDPAANHVVPGMIAKVVTACESGGPVAIWGTGTPRREFLFVDDAADAMVFLMEHYASEEVINIGAGEDVSILQLAEEIGDLAGYGGEFRCDPTKPDGMPRKQLDATRLLAMGWRPATSLRQGLAATLGWYCDATGRPQAGQRHAE